MYMEYEAVVKLNGTESPTKTLQAIGSLLPSEGEEKYDHYIICETTSSGSAVVKYRYPFKVPYFNVDSTSASLIEYALIAWVNAKTLEIASYLEKSCKGRYSWSFELSKIN